MCEPTTIMMGVGMALTAIGGLQAADAQKKQGQYQQKVAENNALTQRWAADDAITRGVVAEDRQRERTRALIGQQRAAMAANGIDVGTGTALDLQADAANEGEFDAMTIRSNAMRQAWGLQTQADNTVADGAMAAFAGDQKATGTLLSTGGSLLTQGGSLYKQLSIAKPTSPGGIGINMPDNAPNRGGR
jgi:hypothetical protein